MSATKLTFGPVPSRRLGRSLGINNIPPKICTYSCVYCQLGRTLTMNVERRTFYPPEEIRDAVYEKMGHLQAAGEAVDYLTFVPDGEPTLDIHLGQAIELLRPLGLPTAVITNASLIWRSDVRAELCKADWVSLKLDAVTEAAWRRIDRSQGALSLREILGGAREFAGCFTGKLATETMLVAEVNDDPATVRQVAEFIALLQPAVAYLAIPTRPPAEGWVRPPDAETINRAYQIFIEKIDQVEYLIGYEGNAFACTGDVMEDLLAITAVHPMRSDAVEAFLTRAGADWCVVPKLIEQGKLAQAEYGGRTFYMLPPRGAIPG